MTRHITLQIATICAGLLTSGESRASLLSKPPSVACSPDASRLETLGAREVRRYVYLRTSKLLPVETVPPASLDHLNGVVVARKDSALARALASEAQLQSDFASLGAQQYLLKTVRLKGHAVVLVIGGDEVGTLYGSYRLAEHLGVRFYLHGDVVPDQRTSLKWPKLNERSAPLFNLRGIQPFHDFPEGPDWWNRDDYLAILSQLPKLRMNFFGLHTYPEGKPNAEPTVWIGLPADVGENGAVKFSYPASYQNTQRGNWGYQAKKTSEFSLGASELFERDEFGPEVMLDSLPQAKTPEACNLVFDRTAAMLRDAFREARRLGIKTCVGTETPLTIPKLVAERLKSMDKNPTNSVVAQELYEGIFRRAAVAYDLDYYWFWTPEGWTWDGTKEAQVTATTNDLFSAIAAAKKVQAPFQLATCGWVLGPQSDRAMFDKVLPKDIAVSCINREVGKTPVDKGFADVSGRSKWAIPWMEDDPGLTSPQLWVGRMRRDAFDAHRYGCDGLMGIHWRTRVLSPNVAALSQAAWVQGDWAGPASKAVEPSRVGGPVGGEVASFTDHPIADTKDVPLYQTLRYKMSAYHWPVSNGLCEVTLKFCEPHYTNSGKRVFDVKLQGKTVLENLDVFAKVGQNRALDYSYKDIEVTNSWLDIEFISKTEYPAIAAISIVSTNGSQNINCGGPAYQDYIADPPAATPPKPVFPPTGDFYQDWALHEFGETVALDVAKIFEKMDCSLPRPSDWVEGPGGIRPDKRPWEKVLPEYTFVEQLAVLGPKVKGAGNQERFNYWMNTFRYMRAIAHVNCVRAEYDRAMEKVKAEKDPAAQKELARQTALPRYWELARLVGEVYQPMLAAVSNPGELGTVANWDQHLLPDLLVKPGKELAKILGDNFPADTLLSRHYHGPTRIIVPTVRSSFIEGEALALKVIILSEKPPREAALHWRQMGKGKFSVVPLKHVARGVYSVSLPSEAAAASDLEYFIKAVPEKGQPILFPATAPQMNQTLVAELR